MKGLRFLKEVAKRFVFEPDASELSFDSELPLISKDSLSGDIPKEDFVDEQYDTNNNARLKKIVLILSTPRSGSTALCNVLYRNKSLVIHEYFQPYQYIPRLAYRWGAYSDAGELDNQEYIEQLVKHRVSEEGVLGINLHGSHLDLLERHFESVFPHVPIKAVHLTRRNKVDQAVSYFLASKTAKWSSMFEVKEFQPEYSYLEIENRLFSILKQEKRIQKFLYEKEIYSYKIDYESLFLSRDVKVQKEFGAFFDCGNLVFPSLELKPQAGDVNKRYAERFFRDAFLKR